MERIDGVESGCRFRLANYPTKALHSAVSVSICTVERHPGHSGNAFRICHWLLADTPKTRLCPVATGAWSLHLEDKLNLDFPPGMDNLKIMIFNMIQYDPAQRWTLNACPAHLFCIGIAEHGNTPLSLTECPSMDVLMERSRRFRQTTTRAMPRPILAPPRSMGVVPHSVLP
jgi:hypothetical protein